MLSLLSLSSLASQFSVVMAWSIPALTARAGQDIPAAGYFSPLASGGSMLTIATSDGLGEPLNAIISANSDKDVMVDQQINGGLRNFFESISFSAECLGQHLGDHQQANLGDGNGLQNETAVIRYNYGDPALGSCKESVQGGNHFRYWVQNGTKADSGAVFLAVSYEQPIAAGHNIIFDGYNFGRDWLVGNITNSPIKTDELTNMSTFSGTTNANGYIYSTTIDYTSGLLRNSSTGVNHFDTVGGGPNHINAVDGLVAVLTVKITGRPPASASSMTSHPTTLTRTFSLLFMSLFVAFL